MRSDISELDAAKFDVAIIGGGINGASAAQHLAAAGYRVLIVDKGDFGSGASSRSSRLLHCGLRYFAPGHSIFDFVRHPTRLRAALRMGRLAMQARSEFVRTAPSRTRAMRFHFPIYRDGPYRPWQINLAFGLLRRLGPKDLPLDYELLSPGQAKALPLIGGLRHFDRLQAVAAFREYQFDWPERICIDTIRDAERLGAVVRNYTRASLRGRDQGIGWTVELTDMASQSPPVLVQAKVVLNMAGVWIDDVLRALHPSATRKVFGTKGCHIMIRLPDACRGIGIATLNRGNEPFYCVPWREFHYFGPTETAYDGDQNRVRVEDQEIDWLLGEANALLPGLRLSRGDVLLTWAGVRPLTFDPAVPFGNRARAIHDLSPAGGPGLLAMTAGPVMMHRSAGREMARAVAAHVAPSQPPSSVDYATPDRIEGAEHALTLSDMLFRRTGVAWSGPISEARLRKAAEEAATALGWDQARTTSEIAAFEAECDFLFGAGTSAQSSRQERASKSQTRNGPCD